MTRQTMLRLAAIPAAVAASTGSALAVDPATAAEALGTFTGTTTAFGPILFGLAVAATAIMIGLAWIKKARGAAR